MMVSKAFGVKSSRVVCDCSCTSCWCKECLVHMLLVQEFFGLKGFWCKFGVWCKWSFQCENVSGVTSSAF